jgi:hypothetical protein
VDLPLWYAYCVSISGKDFNGPAHTSESTSLSIVFKKKDVRLMGLNDLASSYESRPGFGINITLTALRPHMQQKIL